MKIWTRKAEEPQLEVMLNEGSKHCCDCHLSRACPAC